MRQCKKMYTNYVQTDETLSSFDEAINRLLSIFCTNNEKKKCDGNMNSYMNCVTMTEFFILLQLG